MTLDINNIRTELYELERSYHKITYRNRSSLNSLLKMYRTIEDFRASIITDFPGFSEDPLNKVIINNLVRLLEDEKASKEKLEWTFFHYNDLFIFRLSDLLISMDLELK